jgi:hypothetical protein
MFRADEEDFSEFWTLCCSHPALRHCALHRTGALLRSATVFEDVVKTIFTVNWHWRNPKRMVTNLCRLFGESCPGVSDAFAFPIAHQAAGVMQAYPRNRAAEPAVGQPNQEKSELCSEVLVAQSAGSFCTAVEGLNFWLRCVIRCEGAGVTCWRAESPALQRAESRLDAKSGGMVTPQIVQASGQSARGQVTVHAHLIGRRVGCWRRTVAG